MISSIISRLVILVFGTLYPAYASYKAVKTKNIREYVKWMMYWIVFAIFTAVETFADVFISWIPFYYELKIVFVFWLLSPATRGSSMLYRNFVHPRLLKYEPEIDRYISTATDKGYSGMMEVTSRGIDLVKQAVITAAIKGQTTLVTQLSAVERSRSVSLTDMRAVGVNGNGDPALDDFESLGQDLVNNVPQEDMQNGRRSTRRQRQVIESVVDSTSISNIPLSGQALVNHRQNQIRLTTDVESSASAPNSQTVHIEKKQASLVSSMLYPTAAALASNFGLGQRLREMNMERVALWIANKSTSKKQESSTSNISSNKRQPSRMSSRSSMGGVGPDINEASDEDVIDEDRQDDEHGSTGQDDDLDQEQGAFYGQDP